MNLLVVINSLEVGGAEKLLVTTLPYFIQKKINVTLLLLSGKNSEKEYLMQLQDNGVKIIDLNCKSVYDLSAIFKTRSLIKTISFDVIHVHLFPAMYWTALAAFSATSAPLIFTEHSTQNRRLNNIFFKFIDPFIYSRYKWIVCITESINKIIWNKYKIRNTVVINNGVDLSSIDNSTVFERMDLLSELNIVNHSAKLIFMAARFDFPKRQDILIKVLKGLPTNYHVLFAGVGENLIACQELVKSLNIENQVHFLGFRSDVISIMKSVDINLLLSDYEGLSGVTLESLASGVPFLGSNVSGISNVVPDSDYLFDNNNFKDIRCKIITILSDENFANSHAEKASLYVRKFNISNMISSYIELYKNCI